MFSPLWLGSLKGEDTLLPVFVSLQHVLSGFLVLVILSRERTPTFVLEGRREVNGILHDVYKG